MAYENSLQENAGLQLPHDLLLPAPVSWWPPAPGWWLLATLLLMLLTYAGWRLWKKHRLRAPLRKALQELSSLSALPDRDYVAATGQLLRRVAMLRHGRESVAALHGAHWLQFLQNTGAGAVFEQGVGSVLVDIYAPKLCVDRTALAALSRQWLQAQFDQRIKISTPKETQTSAQESADV